MSYDFSYIEKEIFTQRFGSMSVSELRKILFAVYLTGKTADDDYAIGRDLGLTARQVKSLKTGANLLLDTFEQTQNVARAALADAFNNDKLEYQKAKNRIAVQIDDPIAFDYLLGSINNNGMFRDVDAANGHIAVPADRFIDLVTCAYPDLDEEKIAVDFGKGSSAIKAVEPIPKKGFSQWLAKYLPTIESASALVINLGSVIAKYLALT